MAGQKQHDDSAVITAKNINPDTAFLKAVAQHRVWELEALRNPSVL